MVQRDDLLTLEKFFSGAWKQIMQSPDPEAALRAFLGKKPRNGSVRWVTDEMRKCQFCGKPFEGRDEHWPYVIYCDDICREQGIKQMMGRGN